MNSRAKIIALVIALAAVTAPFKLIEQIGRDELPIITAQVQSFLARASDAPPIPARLTTTDTAWSGWQFSTHGCDVQAFLSPSSGVFEQRARLRIGPDDQISYVFNGRVLSSPPIIAGAWNRIAGKLLAPWGVRAKQASYMIVLIAPKRCADAIAALSWPAILAEPQSKTSTFEASGNAGAGG